MRYRLQDKAGRAICLKVRGLPTVFAGALMLVACQQNGISTPVVSLEEAKQITADFGGSFTPPPKSINDIMSSVSEQNLNYRDCDNRYVLSDQDVRNLMQAAPPFSPRQPAEVSIAESQADTQFQQGNYARSVKYMNWAIAAISDEYSDYLAARYAKLATFHALAGDVTAAEDALTDAQGYPLGMRRGSWPNPDWTAYTDFWFNRARATVADSRGDLIRAEAHYRQAIKERRTETNV